MSKRDQGASVDYYIKRGYLPQAVRNYLCLLGWSPKDNREKIPIEEIVRIFDLKNVVRSNATFDPDKLHWLNGEYARELGEEEFLARRRGAQVCGRESGQIFRKSMAAAALQTCKGKINTFDELARLWRLLFCG